MIALPLRRRWLVPLAALIAVAVFLTLVGRFWHPVYGFTALIQLDASNDDVKLTAFRELPVYVHRNNGGYDGLYYAQIALDPSLRDRQLPGAIDNFAYRARRILPPALAWVLGLGQAAWIIRIYPLLNVVAWFALALLLWRLLAVDTMRGWLAWAGVMFSAGALVSVRLALTDLVALAILAGALFAAERERRKTALGALAAAALARETSLLGLAGLVKRPWISWKNFVRTVIAVAPLAAWLAYLRWRVGPSDQGWDNLTVPGAGFVEKWQAAMAATQTLGDKLLAWTTVLATLGLTVQAVFIVTRPRLDDRWWRIGAAYVGLMMFLGTAVWEDYPGAAMRVLLPLTLAFNVVAHRVRAPLVWLIAGNLGVFAGLLAWRDTPFATQELAVAHTGNVAAIARPGDGWFPIEQHGRHRWQWTNARGTVVFETWPRAQSVSLQLDFALRSPTPRTVVLRQDGRELWRAEIGAVLSAHHVVLQAGPGRGTIEFSTDTPGVNEGLAPNTRALAFALYDLQLTVAEK
jgi:hypothetical protein